jgi:hypothetical protein
VIISVALRWKRKILLVWMWTVHFRPVSSLNKPQTSKHFYVSSTNQLTRLIVIWPTHLSLGFPDGLLVSSFYNYNNIHISYLRVPATCASYSPWYYLHNTTQGRMKTMEFLIM